MLIQCLGSAIDSDLAIDLSRVTKVRFILNARRKLAGGSTCDGSLILVGASGQMSTQIEVVFVSTTDFLLYVVVLLG
jgi:hypothetical protein